jgi:hypothetical protein
LQVELQEVDELIETPLAAKPGPASRASCASCSAIRRAAASNAGMTACGPSSWSCRAAASSNVPLLRAATSRANVFERVAEPRMANRLARARTRRRG